jgi:hypothetical protein
MAEMIALAPKKVSDLFQIIIIGPDVEYGNYAQFSWATSTATSLLFNEAAIGQVKTALADVVAEYAVTRTATHVPKWTFMYNPACTEDLDAVAAIRASPPPVAIQFAVNTSLPPGEHCVLFPGGGYWADARGRLLLELQNTKDLCFPARPASATARLILIMDARAVPVRQVVAQLKRLAKDIHTVMLTGSETVTTLWVKESDGYKVHYGDDVVLVQLCKYSMTTAPLELTCPQYVYNYRPGHDLARNLAEMIALAPTQVVSQFSVVSDADLPVHASFVMHGNRALVNEAALAAAKNALMDAVERETKSAEYTFYYDPACQSDMQAIENLRSYPPNVAVKVAVCVRQKAKDDICSSNTSCTWIGSAGVQHRGAVARAKMEETLSALKVARFCAFIPRHGFTCSMAVRSSAASPSGPKKTKLEEIIAAQRFLPDNTVNVQYYDTSCVVTALWTDGGKRVWWGDAAVLAKLKELALQLAGPVAVAPQAAVFDGVRFQMFVRDRERAPFLERLDTVPIVWRRRIAAVFVGDETELAQTCVDLWPQVAGAPPKPTSYQDVLAMLV